MEFPAEESQQDLLLTLISNQGMRTRCITKHRAFGREEGGAVEKRIVPESKGNVRETYVQNRLVNEVRSNRNRCTQPESKRKRRSNGSLVGRSKTIADSFQQIVKRPVGRSRRVGATKPSRKVARIADLHTPFRIHRRQRIQDIFNW